MAEVNSFSHAVAPEAKFLVPDWGILSFLHRVVLPAQQLMYSSLAGRYDNPMPGVDFIPPVRVYEFGSILADKQSMKHKQKQKNFCTNL